MSPENITHVHLSPIIVLTILTKKNLIAVLEQKYSFTCSYT